MEILALIKKAKQDNVKTISPNKMGTFDVDNFDLDDIYNKACNYYLEDTVHDYSNAEIKKFRKTFHTALEFKNGLYNPLNCEVLGVEKSFDIEFKDDWARYEFELAGKPMVGNFSIKGNVDFVFKYSDRIIELVDYKTGQRRKDWGGDSKAKKGYKELLKDFQLQLYYYALTHLYPDKDVLISIYYINDGGLFTIPFERSQLPKIKERIREGFEKIKVTELPKLLSPNRGDWRCKYLCNAFKEKVGNITLCKHIHDEIKKKGLKATTEDNMKPGFDLTKYSDGGGATGLKQEDLNG